MLAGNPDVDLVLGLNDSMALGAYNVIKGKDQYKNVYVAAVGRRSEGGPGVDQVGRVRRHATSPPD